jgi:hypothetical protein
MPKFGQIVWCCFPYNGNLTTQRHPCLILHAGVDAKNQIWVVLAGGTSANKNGLWKRSIKEVDFLLQGDELMAAGLQNPTIFRFEAPVFDVNEKFIGGSLLALPYDASYFVVLATKQTPVIGEIDLQNAPTREKFVRAGKAAKLAELIKQEYQRALS